MENLAVDTFFLGLKSSFISNKSDEDLFFLGNFSFLLGTKYIKITQETLWMKTTLKNQLKMGKTPQVFYIIITYCAIWLHTPQRSYEVAAVHNMIHSPYTTPRTKYPAMLTPQPSMCKTAVVTSTSHGWQSGSRYRNAMKVLWCHSYLLWLVFPSLHTLVILKTFLCSVLD